MSEIKFSYMVKNGKESCPVCLTRFKTTHYLLYGSCIDDNKDFTENETAVGVSRDMEDIKKPCWHHICEACKNTMIKNSFEDMSTEVIGIKCPVCRIQYELEDQTIHDWLNGLDIDDYNKGINESEVVVPVV